MSGEKKLPKLKISFNSPIILGYFLACFGVLVLGWITMGKTTDWFFSVYRSSLANPLTYFRFFGHVLGHANFEHFINNFMYILIVGPLLEEKYGSKNTLIIILTTAFVTGLINFLLFPHSQLLGASGVVFAFILLSSITSWKEGSIPLTLILVAVMYIGQQVFEGVFQNDNVSQLTHIVGGAVGTVLGVLLNKKK